MARSINRPNEYRWQMADGPRHDFDVICVAIGFDVSRGGLVSGYGTAEHTRHDLNGGMDGFRTDIHLGMSGEVEVQGRWIVDATKVMERLRDHEDGLDSGGGTGVEVED
ncbi:hypothetical protein BDW59DRAFT_164481 [Aspergillus cavernicola]|uniref:FAD/NAD(P)-binding domain-containing protein n=1 Tax=Aspergillus cavernicola TaxID=176166 RepID=A0ABR4I0V1_9EURO